MLESGGPRGVGAGRATPRVQAPRLRAHAQRLRCQVAGADV
jgi:hypothetical protein